MSKTPGVGEGSSTVYYTPKDRDDPKIKNKSLEGKGVLGRAASRISESSVYQIAAKILGGIGKAANTVSSKFGSHKTTVDSDSKGGYGENLSVTPDGITDSAVKRHSTAKEKLFDKVGGHSVVLPNDQAVREARLKLIDEDTPLKKDGQFSIVSGGAHQSVTLTYKQDGQITETYLTMNSATGKISAHGFDSKRDYKQLAGPHDHLTGILEQLGLTHEINPKNIL